MKSDMSAAEKQREAHAGGMPKFEPTPEQRATVEAMAGYGIPHDDIAMVIISPRTSRPIDPKTLREAFRDELDAGHVKANAKVVQSLFNQATQGNVTACIWWTKARMNWKEGIEHSGKLEIERIERVIIDHAADRDSARIPAAAEAGAI
jgi:hypothetical protein